MSMANTRLRRCAHDIARCRSLTEPSPRAAEAAVRVPGTIRARSRLAGANTPWYLVKWARGFGTSAASRAIKSSGPFRQGIDADGAQSRYSSEGMKTAQRMERGEIFVGHWVQVRNIPDREAGNATVAALREGGIPEAYLVTTDDEGLKISLGVFGNRDGAERVQALARSLGYPAEIMPRTADGVYYFVDVALPPGRGAGAMIERYGEEKVRMREVSSCPD